jgi:hypothetical protein
MKTHQQAEREEQQRIKNLVLNYDLRDGEDQDGDSTLKPIQPNMNIYRKDAGIEKLSSSHARPDRSSNNRSGQRARKLQLSDVDWYDRRSHNRFTRPSASVSRSSQSQLSTERAMKPERCHSASALGYQNNANVLNDGF